MQIKAIITGSTGMVGEGILHVCLNSSHVESVLVLNRKPCGVEHPKLKEIVHKDFLDLSSIEDQLSGYNACYFCAGVSSVNKKEDEYRRITYDLTINFAKTLLRVNPSTSIHAEPRLRRDKLRRSINHKSDPNENSSRATASSGRGPSGDESGAMIFSYVSGSGTDSSEKGRLAWARIKGKTENDLLKLPFKDAYMFRPGYIEPIKGLKHAYKLYKILSPIYPLLVKLFPKYVGTLEELGNSMIHVTLRGYEKKVLEVEDIRKTS